MASHLPGGKIIKKLNARLGRNHKGYIVAVDPRTGKYLIGKDELAVAIKARKHYPKAHFSVFRIGYPAVHKFRKIK